MRAVIARHSQPPHGWASGARRIRLPVALNDAANCSAPDCSAFAQGGKFAFQIQAIRLVSSRVSVYFLTRSMTAWLMPTAAMRSVSGLDSVHGVHVLAVLPFQRLKLHRMIWPSRFGCSHKVSEGSHSPRESASARGSQSSLIALWARATSSTWSRRIEERAGAF